MRHLFAAATACAAIVLVLPAVAGAATGAQVHKDGGAGTAGAPEVRAQGPDSGAWLGPAARFVPAHKAAVAAAAIQGSVKDYYGSPLAYADVAWYVGTQTGGGGTDGAGQYAFSGIPVAAGNGEITALSSDTNTLYDWWNLSWASPGPTTFEMQPGAVAVDATTRGGPWGQWATSVSTDIFTSDGAEGKEAFRYQEGDMYAPTAPALPGTIEGVAVYFFDDEGAEYDRLNGQSVTAGDTLPQAALVEETDAQRVWTGTASGYRLNRPWGSGKPGSRLKVWLQNYPTTWLNSIVGRAENPARSAAKDFGDFRSLGTAAHSRTLTVPAKAVPGYGYRLWLGHTTGPLSLTTWFQICTLKATKTTITKGTAIRLTGVVPVQGHRGSTPGKRTKVYCFWKRGTASQPTVLDPTKQGWRYVGYVNTDAYGKYRTPLIKPGATRTFVMLYPGDDWYYAGYTSPRRITVR